MPTFYITSRFALLAVCVVAVSSAKMWAQDPVLSPHTIVLDADKGPQVFGKLLSLRVTYHNSANEAWRLTNPSTSRNVRLNYRPRGSTERPQGYGMASATTVVTKGPNEQSIEAFVPPKVEISTIDLGKTLVFNVNFEKGWTGDVVPGHWTVWIEDQTEKLQSNQIDIVLRFTRESLKICLAVAMDKSQPLIKRKWHANWLQKVDGSLKFVWPSDEESGASKAKMEDAVQMSLKGFQTFIDDVKNEKKIADAILEINRSAGIDESKP